MVKTAFFSDKTIQMKRNADENVQCSLNNYVKKSRLQSSDLGFQLFMPIKAEESANYKQFIEDCNRVDCIVPLLSINRLFNNIITLLFHLNETNTINFENVGLNLLLKLLGVGTQLDDLGFDANLMWLASNAKQFTYQQYISLVSIHFDLTIIVYKKFKSEYISFNY